MASMPSQRQPPYDSKRNIPSSPVATAAVAASFGAVVFMVDRIGRDDGDDYMYDEPYAARFDDRVTGWAPWHDGHSGDGHYSSRHNYRDDGDYYDDRSPDYSHRNSQHADEFDDSLFDDFSDGHSSERGVSGPWERYTGQAPVSDSETSMSRSHNTMWR